MNKLRVLLLIVVTLSVIQLIKAQGQGRVLPLSNAEKLSILNYHNNLRAAVNARNVPALTWKDSLGLWADYNNSCSAGHTSNAFRSNKAGYSYIGENLAFASANVPVETFVSGWGAEKSDYTYGPMTLTNFAQVGHYTQLMWYATVAIGCVRLDCTGVGIGGYVMACNYGPGGNYLNQYPYLLCTTGSCALLSPSSGGLNLGNSGSGSTPSTSRTSAASQSSTTSQSSAPSQSPSPTRSIAASQSNTRSISTTATRTPSTSTSLTPTSTTAPSATSSPIPSCAPKTCTANSCGTIATGCGGSINCGTCSAGSNCVNNLCVACTPTQTCSNKQCGTLNIGCGATINCGTCASGLICENYTCIANPICKSCSDAGANCGTITISGCPIQSCGTCASGNTCTLGKCTPITCTSPCGRNAVCVNGICTCLNGYINSTGSGNGCTAITIVPDEFNEIYSSTGTENSWVYAPLPIGNYSTLTTPELDTLLDVTDSSRLAWNNANIYSSFELTTLTAQVYFGSSSSIVGLGLRLGQGSPRDSDAIQWTVDVNGRVDWTLIWFGNNLNYGQLGSGSFGNTPPLSNWNTISLSVLNTNISGVSYQASTFSINGVAVVKNQAVRPYDVLGGAYLYSLGPSSWRNVMINTRTSLRVSIANCLSSDAFAALVSRVLGIPAANVRVVNTTINGVCAGQSTNKRQAAGSNGNVFIISIDSVTDSGSRALASQFTQLASSWDDTLSETGGVKNVEEVDPALVNTEPVSGDVVDLTATSGGGTGLSGGAIAGIVVGGVVGLALIVLAVAAVIGVVVFVVARSRKSGNVDVEERGYRQEVVQTEVGKSTGDLESGGDGSARTPKGRTVDMFELSPRHHKSITGRIPSGYQPDIASIEQK